MRSLLAIPLLLIGLVVGIAYFHPKPKVIIVDRPVITEKVVYVDKPVEVVVFKEPKLEYRCLLAPLLAPGEGGFFFQFGEQALCGYDLRVSAAVGPTFEAVYQGGQADVEPVGLPPAIWQRVEKDKADAK